MKPPRVTITDFCLNHTGYYDWLVTGFGLLGQEGTLDFRYRLPLAKSLMRHRYVRWGAKGLACGWVERVNGPSWCLEGEIDFGGKTVRFVFDVTDHGDLWNVGALERCDLYFKCQLPASFPGALELSRHIIRPLPAEVATHAGKVRPAMLGRPLSRALDFRKNLQALRQWESAAAIPRTRRIFAYFGGDRDPETAKWTGFPYQHPNEKRARLVSFLRSLHDPRVDARLIESRDPSLLGPGLEDEPFRRAIGQSAFNLNVSGFSKSIPFRFIDSFLAGTAILTDSLAVRWYEPFDLGREVIDLGPMGYELEQDVDWPAAERGILAALDRSDEEVAEDRAVILERYHRLWSPAALAAHVLAEARALT